MGIERIDAVCHLHILMYPCSTIRDRLADVEGVPLRKADALLDRIDLKFSGHMDKVHARFGTFAFDH